MEMETYLPVRKIWRNIVVLCEVFRFLLRIQKQSCLHLVRKEGHILCSVVCVVTTTMVNNYDNLPSRTDNTLTINPLQLNPNPHSTLASTLSHT